MSNDLMIPDKASVPSYVLDPNAARQANDDAAAGISTGYPARIKLNGKSFALVDGSGEEKSFPASKLFIAPDEQQYLPVVVLRARRELSKQWYASAYNPGEEGRQPDCFSLDSLRPDPSAVSPQNDICASCPQNAFGSGRDQAGQPTKGKACTDNKILAVFVPNYGVHQLKIPPASLKPWGVYVKQLNAAGIPVGKVNTLVGFDPTQSFPVLVFKFGGYLPEAAIGKVTELAQSVEAEEIVTVGAPILAPPPKQVSGPTEAELKAKAAADEAARKAKAEEAHKAAQAEALAKEKARKEAELAKKEAETLDLGLGDMGLAAPPAEKPTASPSDDELAKALGLI